MDLQRLHELDLAAVEGMRLFDNEFLKAVFDGDNKCTELLLNVIFDRDDIAVLDIKVQREIKGLEGHSVRLDILAEDCEHKIYNIEIEKTDGEELPKRSRYYSSLLDTTLLKPNEKYSKLVDTYVIFFTEKDTIGDGLPLHKYEMYDVFAGRALGDGRHIIFVNGANKDESTRLGKLVHDFKCTSPDDMYYKTLADRVRYFKKTEKGVGQMNKALEEIKNMVAEEARAEGKAEGKAEAKTEGTAEGKILGAILFARRYNIPEAQIKADIMGQFDLTEKKAEEYMRQAIA